MSRESILAIFIQVQSTNLWTLLPRYMHQEVVSGKKQALLESYSSLF